MISIFVGEPQLVILEEPQQHGQRFRYKCEGRSAGSIQGAKSSSGRKSVPAVQVHDFTSYLVTVHSSLYWLNGYTNDLNVAS